MNSLLQDAAGKVQDAAATNYDAAKNRVSDVANAAAGKAEDVKGDAKVGEAPLLLAVSGTINLTIVTVLSKQLEQLSLATCASDMAGSLFLHCL